MKISTGMAAGIAARIAARIMRRVAPGACICALLCGWSLAQAQTVDVATAPLYSGGAAAPNVAIVASFEFPTFGQAYIGVGYNASQAYVGYFNPAKCYLYNGNSTIEDPNGYFYISSDASTNHTCIASFSGSFMNYATITAADEFRYALTGGTRVLENGPNAGTILQRAYLTGCNANDTANCTSFVSFDNQQIRGVPDFYANSGTFPTLGAYAGLLGGSGIFGAYVNNCKTFMYLTSSTSGATCFAPNKDLGIYNVRVNVCDANEGPVRTDLCLYYPAGGKYKPVGVVQKNVTAMRFSIFGYLIDRTVGSYVVPPACNDSQNSYPTGIWNRCRVGGVLRAPMKYVGPTTYNASGVASSNANAEVNADGTFVDDPEHVVGTAAARGGKYSGFINYLNRFGGVTKAGTLSPSDTGGAGEYKRFDTLGEMYYEAIRYYQNLGPTPETYQPQNGVAYPDQVAGYFPVISNWTDPIIAACSKNYIVAIADAYTWDDTYLPGYNGSPPVPPQNNQAFYRPNKRAVEGGLDAYAWTQKIGVLEATTPAYGPSGNDVHPQMLFYTGSGQSSTGIQDALAGSQRTGTYLDAGAAYWANTNDIRSDLAGVQTIKTIAIDVGSGGNSNLWDRQLYLMGKYGGFNNTIDRSVDGSQANPFYATDPANTTGPAIRTNAEWESAPGSGYPANYLFARDPQALINGLQAAFSQISSQSGTASGGSVTSANLTYGAAGVYVSRFSNARWSGSVLYESVSSVNGQISVNTTPIWDSGLLLTTRCDNTPPFSTVCTDSDTSVNKRNIVTTITSSTGVRSATNFVFANLSTDLNYTRALNVDPATRSFDNLGQQRLNYLRGYRADESSTLAFRARDSAMGDIINSAPVYVGAPTTGIPDTAYQTFLSANVGRTAAVYAGANDGMMHAFNASTGAELFAYVPGLVSLYLSDLTNPAYTHDPYVDAIPVVQEAKVNGAFKTVLVSGTGGGARGVFALDVTDPTAFDPTKVLFEFSESDDYDIGNVVFPPKIVKLQTGTTTSGGVTSPTYGYFAAITSYNSHRPLCNSPGNANLLQQLVGGLGAFNAIPNCANNSQGDVYYVGDPKNQGVLFLLSLDRTIGTPWVKGTNYFKYFFPAKSTAARNGLGPVAALPTGTGDGATAALYFGDLQGQMWRLNTVGAPAAWTPSIGSVSAPQPVFVATDANGVAQPITDRPELATGPFGSTLVVFGTGAYLGMSDLASPYAQQSEYGLIDTNGSTLISRAADLVQRNASVSNGQVTVTGSTFTYNGGTSKKGWYIDFPSTSSGERMVNKAAIAPGLLTFTSLTLASSVCGSGGGYVYQINPLSGLPLGGNIGGYTSTVGIPGPPVIVDLSVAAGQARPTGETINSRTQTTLVSGTSGGIAGIGTPPAMKAPPIGRVSWREITNYNDLPKTP